MVSILLCPRMGCTVNSFEFFESRVGVDLCRRQFLMSQQLLHRLQVGLVIKHRGGKGMPEHVRATFPLEGHEPQLFPHHRSHLGRLQAFSLSRDEERLA